MILSRKVIAEGERFPKGYGLAWRNFDVDQMVCYPIPINLVLRVFRSIYFRAMKGLWCPKWEKELNAAFSRGKEKQKNVYQDELIALATKNTLLCQEIIGLKKALKTREELNNGRG